MSRLRVALWLLAITGLLAWAGMTMRGLGAQAEPVPVDASPPVELAPIDVTRVQRAPLVDALAITGSLRAVRTALVKSHLAASVSRIEVREGDAVRRGQLVVRLDDVEARARLRQAGQNMAAAEAQRDIAQRNLDNNQALVSQGFISRNALQTSLSNLATAQAQVEAARAARDLAAKAVADAVVHAPIEGLVSQRFVQPGERVGVDARLLEIVDLSALELEAAVPADRVLSVRVGAPARLQVEGGADVDARVVRINPGTHPGTRSVMVYLAVEQPAGLRQGLFARGEIVLSEREALVLPLAAVRIDRSRPYVLVLQDGVATTREVRLGARGRSGGQEVVEILEGPAEGAIVLAASAGAVRPGARVRLPDALR